MIPPGTDLGAVRVSLPGSPVAGRVDAQGRQINVGKLEGWWAPPATSGSATQKVNEHGAFLGPAYYGPRVIVWETRVDGLSPADSMATALLLTKSLPVSGLAALSVTDEQGTLTARVRQEGAPLFSRQGNRVTVSLSMIAPDPRRYGPPALASTGLPLAAGGFILPVVLPIVIGGNNLSGEVDVFNNGDMDSQPTFTVYGPCAPFTITDDQGKQLAFAESLDAGRSLIIDTSARTALLDGVANRVVTGTWPVLRPGANSFRFDASAYNVSSLMTVSHRSAWR
jgi:Phage tail protein